MTTSYLLDTHVLLWIAQDSPALSSETAEIVADPRNEVWFGVVNIWEVVIKSGLGRPDFRVDPTALRDRALLAGYHELPVRGGHVLELAALPPIHADPFDRMLLAQARFEDMVLLTADAAILRYGAPARNA